MAKWKTESSWRNPQDSPVDEALRRGPRGDGDWKWFNVAYRRIALGCERMAQHRRLTEDHVESMADLGSGHEERMKYRVRWMLMYGYLTNDDLVKTASEDPPK